MGEEPCRYIHFSAVLRLPAITGLLLSLSFSLFSTFSPRPRDASPPDDTARARGRNREDAAISSSEEGVSAAWGRKSDQAGSSYGGKSSLNAQLPPPPFHRVQHTHQVPQELAHASSRRLGGPPPSSSTQPAIAPGVEPEQHISPVVDTFSSLRVPETCLRFSSYFFLILSPTQPLGLAPILRLEPSNPRPWDLRPSTFNPLSYITRDTPAAPSPTIGCSAADQYLPLQGYIRPSGVPAGDLRPQGQRRARHIH